MARLPTKDAELLNWTAERLAAWAGQGTPPNIGITADQVAAAAALLSDAEAALGNAISLDAQSKAAFDDKRSAIGALRRNLGGLIDTIEAFAKTSEDPGVYSRALIDPPKPPAPREDPPQPAELATQSTSDGSVLFTFKVTAGAGATFEVQRRATPLTGEGPGWQHLATVGDKRYLDQAVPVGLRRVEYRVRVTLSSGVTSPWSIPAPFDFGTPGSQGGPLTIAA